jgi:hypothetical protein
VTDRDIAIRGIAEGIDPNASRIEQIASRDLFMADPEQDLDVALTLMAQYQVRQLPVVDRNHGRLVGIIAQADIAINARKGRPASLSNRSHDRHRRQASALGRGYSRLSCLRRGFGGTGLPVRHKDSDQRDIDNATRRAVARGDDPPARRRRRLAAILIGAVVGYALGGGFVLLFDRARYSGSASDIVVWLVGLPSLLAIGGAVIGSLVAAWPAVEDVDASLRMRKFARQGRAATSEQGQLPGSPVPPHYDTTTPDAPKTNANQRSRLIRVAGALGARWPPIAASHACLDNPLDG